MERSIALPKPEWVTVKGYPSQAQAKIGNIGGKGCFEIDFLPPKSTDANGMALRFREIP
jgi:hypothetical protein